MLLNSQSDIIKNPMESYFFVIPSLTLKNTQNPMKSQYYLIPSLTW